jgi:hypothetical protein
MLPFKIITFVLFGIQQSLNKNLKINKYKRFERCKGGGMVNNCNLEMLITCEIFGKKKKERKKWADDFSQVNYPFSIMLVVFSISQQC